MLTTPADVRTQIRSHDRGSRIYTIEGIPYPSVTTIVSQGEPKPVLVNWAKKVTAEAAVNQHELIGKLIEQDGPRAAIDHLKGAAYRQRDAAGDLGSKLHEVAEYEILEGKPYPEPGDPQARRLLSHFRDFVKVMAPTWHAVEGVVFSTEHQYAGTLDAVATLNPAETIGMGDWFGAPLLIDWKSGSGVYGSYAMQLAAYAHCDTLLGPTGPVPFKETLPEARAAVVHITSQGWSLVAVDVGPEVLEAFLACRVTAQWAMELSRSVVGHSLAMGKATPAALVPPGQKAVPEVVTGFGERRRIKPPSLAK